jgi:pimeloyl-ACP methyl ester carboxylesterase
MSKDNSKSGYSEVGGLKMYYEIYGEGKPLVLIHGGGSTIQTTYGNIIPLLSKHQQIIAMELQAHGRTGDRVTDLSFEQDADDVTALLHNLNIRNANFLGYSNGGHTLIEIALRHPEIINKMIFASAFFKRSAVVPQFWEGFDSATIDVMPQSLKDGFLKVNNNEKALLNMFNKDVQKMKDFKGWSEEQMKSIKSPALIINGNNDVGSVEHAVEMYRTIPGSQLAILPGKHGAYIGAVEYLNNGNWPQHYIVDLINEFLNDQTMLQSATNR